MEANKQVGIWIRVSTDFQVRDESPEIHEERARYYAKAKGWDVVEVYRLDAVSGKTVMNHPEAVRMLKDIRSGHITGLVFSKLARLARSTKELLEFADIFRKEGADLISLAEQIDTSTPAGRLFFTMISAMAQWEREEISSRVAASIPVRARLGRRTGGAATFGYKWEDGTFQVDEKEAPVRKLLYDLYLQHRRKKAVARMLNDLGHRTRGGAKFNDTTIDRLLRDPTAKGIRIANYTKSNSTGGRVIIKPEEEWVVIDCPAIVEVDVWEKCNQILKDQAYTQRVVGRTPVYLLSGYVKCTCGQMMYARTSAKKYTCKPCNIRIAVSDLDEIYQEYLKGYLNDINPTVYFSEAENILKEKEQLLAMADKKRKGVKKKMDELVPLRLNDELSKEHFAELYKPLELQAMQLDTSIPELQADVDFRKIQIASSDVVLTEAKSLYEEWCTMPFEQKRSIIETITECITIDKEDITISLCYLPSLEISENGNTSMQLWSFQ
jgi:site-specific DNA recombinase